MNWLRFSNPIRYQQLQAARPTKRPRLGSEHVDWRMLDSRGDWVVVLVCGSSGKTLGPVSVRYSHPQDAGTESYRLMTGRTIAKGCYVAARRVIDLWDAWGRDTQEFERYGE